MNLYRITQNVNDGWDTYRGAVVAAINEVDARNIHPNNLGELIWDKYDSWCRPDQVKVELIGVAVDGLERGVIIADYING